MNASLVAVHAPAPTFQAPGPAPTPARSARTSFSATPTATVTSSSLERALGFTNQRAEVKGWAELVKTTRVCSVGSCANVLEPGWPWKRCPGCKEADNKKTVTVSCSSCHAAMTVRLNVARAGQPMFCASCRASQLVSPEVPIQQPQLTIMGPPPQIPDEMRRKTHAPKPITSAEGKSALETAIAFVHPDHRHLLHGQDLAPPPLDSGRRFLSYQVPIQSSSIGAPHYGPRGEILARVPGTIAMEQAHRASAVAQPVTYPQTGLTPTESIVIPASDGTETADQDKAHRHRATAPPAPNDAAPPHKRKRTHAPTLSVDTSLMPERACVSPGCIGRIPAGTKGEFCTDCSFVLWRKQFRARVAGLSASFITGRGAAGEGQAAAGDARDALDGDATDVEEDELPLALVLKRKRRAAALEKSALATTSAQGPPSPPSSSDLQPVKATSTLSEVTTQSPGVDRLPPRSLTPPTTATVSQVEVSTASPAAAKPAVGTVSPEMTATSTASPSPQLKSSPQTAEPSIVALPPQVEREPARSPPTSRSASPEIPLKQVISPLRSSATSPMPPKEPSPLAAPFEAENVSQEAEIATLSSSDDESEDEISDDSSSSRSSTPSPPTPVRPRLVIRIPSRKRRSDTDILRRQLEWDSDGSELTPLEDSANEGESEIDNLSDGEDGTPTITQPLDSIVHEPDSGETPPAPTSPRRPKHRGICSVPQCANLLAENSRWRICGVCFGARRAYVRRQKQAGVVPQDPVEEVGMIVNMPEDGDLTGYRKCGRRSCKRMVPPESAYKWKCCPPCRVTTRNDTRLRRARARGEPLHFLGEDGEERLGEAHSALPDARVRHVKDKARKLKASQPSSESPSQVQDTRRLPEVPAYQHFAALLTAFHARFTEFKVAHAHYLRFKAQQEAGGADVQKINRNPIVFRFDGEYSVVADPSGGSVDEAVNCVLRNVQAALGLPFTAVGVNDGPEDSVVAVLRCLYGAQVLLRTPSTPAQKSPTDAENVEASESPKEDPPPTLAVKMVGELQICVAWDRRHKFFPGQRILVRFRLVG
ncbi:hypothetical protein C8Q73DRAFT_363159 [Cubamyces lactineus]|nr:hypothetical protein C8Q73DRAFT_363159 [Cubamyces lactineus]